MPSSTPTKFQKLVLATSLITNVVLGGHAFYVEGSQRTTGNIEAGGNIKVEGQIAQSGGIVPIRATLTGSGQKSIQNPVAYKVRCGAPTLYVQTAASPITLIDGKQAAGPGDVGNTLFNDVALSAGLLTSTGSAVNTADGPKEFLLDEAGGTNDYIFLSGVVGSGQSLVATFNMDCYRATN